LVALDENGGIHPTSEDPRPNATRGVRITFAGADEEERTLYYFSTDLSNRGVRSSGFLKFCDTLAPGSSLIKSASYLLHSPNFTLVRDWLLANSTTIIQDDSGIPLANYGARQWQFFPFGRYLGPIAMFPNRYQERYAELFMRAQPIDFGIGYRWRAHESNLLLLVKVPGSEQVQAESASSAEPPPASPQRPKGQPSLKPILAPLARFFWFLR